MCSCTRNNGNDYTRNCDGGNRLSAFDRNGGCDDRQEGGCSCQNDGCSRNDGCCLLHTAACSLGATVFKIVNGFDRAISCGCRNRR